MEVYETGDGKAPFQDWVDGIRDKTAKTLVYAQIRKASLGNFGDWKFLSGADGIREMRIPYGQGFRIYYALVGQTLVLILAGSTKRDQDKVIAKAIDFLEDHNRRMKR